MRKQRLQPSASEPLFRPVHEFKTRAGRTAQVLTKGDSIGPVLVKIGSDAASTATMGLEPASQRPGRQMYVVREIRHIEHGESLGRGLLDYAFRHANLLAGNHPIEFVQIEYLESKAPPLDQLEKAMEANAAFVDGQRMEVFSRQTPAGKVLLFRVPLKPSAYS